MSAILRGIHPTIAHFVTISTIIDIHGKKVVIRSMHDKSEKEYTLVLPSSGSCDLKVALFTKEFIPYLLKQGYYPMLKGNKVKLMPPHQDKSVDPIVLGRLQFLCDQTMDLLTKAGFENIRDLLQEFKDAVTNSDFPLAQELIDTLREMRGTDNIERIYAVFLSLNHQPERAAEVFKTLADRALEHYDSMQATDDLEDALVCNPKDSQTYRKLVRIHDSDERRLLTYFLFAYLNESDPKIADEWLAEAKTYGPKEPLLELANRKLDDHVACDLAKQCEQEAIALKKSLREYTQSNAQSLPTSPKAERRPTQFKEVIVSSVRSALHRSSSDRVDEQEPKSDSPVRTPLLRTSAAERASSRTSRAETVEGSSEGGKGNFLEISVQNLRKSFRARTSRANTAVSDLFDQEPQEEKVSTQKKVSFKTQRLQLLNLLGEDKSVSQNVKLREVLRVLKEHYFEVKNWRKAEIIFQIMIENLPTVASFPMEYADLLKRSGRKEEAAKMLLDRAIRAHESGCSMEVENFLNKINEIDPKWEVFTLNQKKILYMLLPTPERLEKLQDPLRDTKQEDFICQQAFFTDHPSFVACYINEEHLFLIGTDRVYVEKHGQDEGVDYELALPQDASAAPHELLSRKGYIQALIKKGWMPVVKDEAVVLQKPIKNDFSYEKFIREARDILDLVNVEIQNGGKEIKACSALKEFLEVIGRSPSRAQEALKQAAECMTPPSLDHLSVRTNKLYGDYLFARKKMDLAKAVYRNLSSRVTDREQKRLFLERAFFCDPTRPQIVQDLQVLPVSDAQKHFRELYAYLHVQGTDKARELYQKSSKNPWVQLAALNCIPKEDKVQRMKALSQLATIYRQTDKELSTYYRTCSQIENKTAADLSEGVTTLLEGCKQLKEKKKVALRIIDTLIGQGAFDEAARMLKIIQIKQLWVEGGGGALGRRELLLCDAQNNEEMKSTAKRLISLYTEAKKYAKVSAVAYLSFKKCKTFEKICVKSLVLQKKEKEAVQVAIEIAFSLICEGQLKRASNMLSEARGLDPDLTGFNDDEKLLIQLMETTCHQ